jgi:hypothetical protein
MKRWLRQIRDPAWQRLLDKIRTGPKNWDADSLIDDVLLSLSEAKEQELDRESQKERKKQSKALKGIAVKIDEVVQILRKEVEREKNVPSPEDWPEDPDPIVEATKALDWLERQAKAFHTRAKYFLQRDGKRYDERHSAARVCNNFAAMISRSLREVTGQPLYAHVSDITNIVFPAADMTEDRVIAACKPTTRAGRRGKAGALKRTKLGTVNQ